MLSSSIQAGLDNPYGLSKRRAEEILKSYAEDCGAAVAIYRLKNVFGKWCRPNYNSVVATFCYNVAHDLPLTISDASRRLDLCYVDDVVRAFRGEIVDATGVTGCSYAEVEPAFSILLGELAERIRSYRETRCDLSVPEFVDPLNRRLYPTYLSYLDGADFGYALQQRTDARGCLAEFLKSPPFGQVFVSRTKPGVTRGNHYHDTKVEKFLVLEGDAVIRFRHILEADVVEHRVSGQDLRVLDIPPGYTHSIENVGKSEMITLFWADEVFDPGSPDTYPCEVVRG